MKKMAEPSVLEPESVKKKEKERKGRGIGEEGGRVEKGKKKVSRGSTGEKI